MTTEYVRAAVLVEYEEPLRSLSAPQLDQPRGIYIMQTVLRGQRRGLKSDESSNRRAYVNSPFRITVRNLQVSYHTRYHGCER